MKMRNLTFCLSLALATAACSSGGGGGNGGSQSSSLSSSSSSSQSSSSSSSVALGEIKINQIGFSPSSPKIAVIPSSNASAFEVRAASDNSLIMSGNLSAARDWAPAEQSYQLADFSDLSTQGDYQLVIEGFEPLDFKVEANIYQSVHDASLKAYYFNRASTALDANYAGQWARAAGHPDTEVRIHPSAATAERPAESTISAPKGWYDAGDFGKYVVNAGISTYTLMAAYEHFSTYYDDLSINIPESGNGVPDILNEVMWNLEWMEKMQDSDGGVYHKLTTKNFAGTVMPANATAPRYVVQKSTAATLDFAATMAVASRIYANYPAAFPGKADIYQQAAVDAWLWALSNDNVAYVQTSESDVQTGAYISPGYDDEFAWAAAELFILTQEPSYLQAFKDHNPNGYPPGWGNVSALGLMSLAQHKILLSDADQSYVSDKISAGVSGLLSAYQSSAFAVTNNSDSSFYWGSNSGFLNGGMMLIQAYRLTDNSDYLEAAFSALDYVLGRNATDYSFVTGFGTKSPMHIHHRQSEADNVNEPVPGFVVGGPHDGLPEYNCSYPNMIPARSYVDKYCSYSRNEVTINWNAPLVYLLAAVNQYY